MTKKPYIYIVGAGPGDAELLTLKAHRLLTTVAEVVIYDRLVPDEILAIVPAHVEKIYAGKSCRNHCMTQDEINHTLVEEAKKGRIILRLKGGDPFIFGRGGEEMQCLIDHHIPFEIVPGISAASGISAALGIPLTHRGLAKGVHYITGHQQKGLPIDLNWQQLADPDTTLVVYMGLAHLEEIATRLIQAGLDKATPVMAVQEGTTPKQRQLVAPLAAIYEQTKAADFAPPTLIIIGKVVGLYKNLLSSRT